MCRPTRRLAALETRHSPTWGAAVRRCAQCHGKLGLGVRFRNLWNGRWWVHLRFCSAHCEGLYELERYEANARHRWYSFLTYLRHCVVILLQSSSASRITGVHPSSSFCASLASAPNDLTNSGPFESVSGPFLICRDVTVHTRIIAERRRKAH